MGRDLREPQSVRPYQQQVLAPQDVPLDWVGMASLMLGSMANYLKMRMCAWPALLLCLASMSSMKRSTADWKLHAGTLAFSLVSLASIYTNVKNPRPKDDAAPPPPPL